MHFDGADFLQQVRNYHCFARPIMDVGKQSTSLPGEAHIVPAPRLTVVRLINRLAMFTHPTTDSSKNAFRFWRDGTIGSWANVQKIVTTVPGAVDEIAN